MADRVKLHQLPLENMKVFWRQFEPSDYGKHRECGYVPTAERCVHCDRRIGKAMAQQYSFQLDVLEDDHLTLQVAGGEQVGKSFTGAMKAYRIVMAFLGEYGARAANEVAWLVGQSYEQTAREFEYLKAWFRLTPGLTFTATNKVDPGEIRIAVPNGTFIIKTKSADDSMGSLRMESPVFVLLCEAAICMMDTYTRLRSRVARARADFPGYGAIVMISTFEGSVGWYPTLFSKWQLPATREKENAASFSMPSFSNVFIYKGGENDPEIKAMKADLGENEYKERVLAIPSPPRGRVHSRFDPTVHILPKNAKYDPEVPVLIGIDPGYSGQPSTYAVEVFQRRYLPCENLHYNGIDEIFDWEKENIQICDMATKRFWWKNEIKHGVIDIAGHAHAGANIPAAEVWRKETGLVLQAERVNILPGIQRMDSMLNLCVDPNCGEPVLTLSPNQEGLIAELGGLPHPHDGSSHPYAWATDRVGDTIGKTPADRYNDAVKATTYLFVNQIGYTNTARSRGPIRTKKLPRRSRRRELVRA